MTTIGQKIEKEFQQLSFYEQIDLIGRLLAGVSNNSLSAAE